MRDHTGAFDRGTESVYCDEREPVIHPSGTEIVMHRRLSVIALLLVLVLALLPAPNGATAQGQLYVDTMDAAETGYLSTDTFDPAISFAYQGGQYVVTVQTPNYDGAIYSTVNLPVMTESMLTVDATMTGDLTGKFFIAGCRQTDAGDGYRFGLWPGNGDVMLWRYDAATQSTTTLAQSNNPALVVPSGTMVRVGMSCAGSELIGFVNGQQALTAADATYPAGRPLIGLGASGQATDGLMVGFDNLTVMDNGVSAQPVVETPAAGVSTEPQMAPIADPAVDPTATLNDAFRISLNVPPLVSGLGGDTDVELDFVRTLPAGVQVADFYAEMYFYTPDLPPDTVYLAGFCFWVEPDGSCYDIYLEDSIDGTPRWGYGYDSKATGSYELLDGGDLPPETVDPTPGEVNFLSLTVYRGYAILSGNTFGVDAVIPLQGTPLVGDVKAEIGFQSLADVGALPPLVMSTSDFAVWDLSSSMAPMATDEPPAQPTAEVPAAPTTAALPTVALPAAPTVEALPTVAPTVASLPTAAPSAPTVATLPTAAAPTTVAAGPVLPPIVDPTGTIGGIFDQIRQSAITGTPIVAGFSEQLTQDAQGYGWSVAGTSILDSYTIVTFTNPMDVSAPNDVGIGFRTGEVVESGLRVVVAGDGTVYSQVIGQQLVPIGKATSFDPAPGASNTIELIAQGPTGVVAVNGEVMPTFDISAVMTPGDVYIGTGFIVGDTVADRKVPFQNWWTYAIGA